MFISILFVDLHNEYGHGLIMVRNHKVATL